MPMYYIASHNHAVGQSRWSTGNTKQQKKITANVIEEIPSYDLLFKIEGKKTFLSFNLCQPDDVHRVSGLAIGY